MGDRLKSNLLGREVRVEFTEQCIKTAGPFSSGELLWTGLKSIEHTKKGIVIRPETGIVFYVPKALFADLEQINMIINKAKK